MTQTEQPKDPNEMTVSMEDYNKLWDENIALHDEIAALRNIIAQMRIYVGDQAEAMELAQNLLPQLPLKHATRAEQIKLTGFVQAIKRASRLIEKIINLVHESNT